jgi:hypothetical protein
MRILAIAGALFAVLIAAQTTASAQERLRSNERYCLEASGGRGGGPQPLLCRFETMAQCRASKTGPTDRCMLNPALDSRR